MNNMFIKDLHIKWEDIGERSYIRGIPAIAYGFNPEGGTKNYSFSTYDSHSELCNAIRLSKGYLRPQIGYFLRAESFYNVATKEEEYSRGAGGVPQQFHKKSHGESFMQVVENYFKPNGIYILDEPEAALSSQRQLTLMYHINRYSMQGSQFIIVSHSPILLGMPDAEIISFDDGSLHTLEYEETESYKITEMFINNRERMLHNLLIG